MPYRILEGRTKTIPNVSALRICKLYIRALLHKELQFPFFLIENLSSITTPKSRFISIKLYNPWNQDHMAIKPSSCFLHGRLPFLFQLEKKASIVNSFYGILGQESFFVFAEIIKHLPFRPGCKPLQIPNARMNSQSIR